jgi:hypothetical protein
MSQTEQNFFTDPRYFGDSQRGRIEFANALAGFVQVLSNIIYTIAIRNPLIVQKSDKTHVSQ